MGKESAPAPDPRLVEAQIRSLGIQEDAVNRILGLSEEMAPLQRQQMMDSLERSGVLWEQGQEDRQFALGKRAQLSGIQDAIAQEASAFSESDRRDQLAGEAGANITQAFSAARETMQRDRARMGINPNDGRASALDTQMGYGEALAQATGRNQAGQQARGERIQLQNRANDALAGYPAMTAGSVGTGMQTMGAGMGVLQSGMAGLNAGNQAAIGGAQGFGSQAGGMYNAQANRFDNANAADAQGGAALGSAVGGIAIAVI